MASRISFGMTIRFFFAKSCTGNILLGIVSIAPGRERL